MQRVCLNGLERSYPPKEASSNIKLREKRAKKERLHGANVRMFLVKEEIGW